MDSPHPNETITQPATWADGYGYWHCRLPNTPNAYREARRRIVNQLDMRGHIRRGDRVYLERIHAYGDGTIEYTERRN